VHLVDFPPSRIAWAFRALSEGSNPRQVVVTICTPYRFMIDEAIADDWTSISEPDIDWPQWLVTVRISGSVPEWWARLRPRLVKNRWLLRGNLQDVRSSEWWQVSKSLADSSVTRL
jgi:hypothetical protein